MSVREVTALLFREIKLVALAFLLPIAAALALFAHAPKSYDAAAKVLVNGRDEQARGELTPQVDPSAPQTTSQEILNSEVEILTSQQLAARAVKAVGAHRLFPRLPVDPRTGEPDADAAVGAFAHALHVHAVGASNVIVLTLSGPSPQIATEALARFLAAYEQVHRHAFSRPIAGYLAGQLRGLEGGLRGVEEQIAAFTERQKLFDPEIERKNLLDTRSALSASAIQLRAQGAEQVARAAALKRVRARTPDRQRTFGDADESDSLARARAQLLDLRQQQTKLAANYQPASRAMQDLNAQIATVGAFVAQETRRLADPIRTTRNPLYDQMTTEIAEAEAQVQPTLSQAAAIDGQVAGINARLARIAEAEKTLRPLERARAERTAAIAAFRQREAEALLSEGLDRQRMGAVKIIQESAPVSLTEPAKPKLAMFLIGGVVGGVLLAGAVTAVFFLLKNTFLGPESVEARTKIPVLVSLPAR